MQNGPVVAGFDVYEDFSHYKSGIYKEESTERTFMTLALQHTAGRLTGGHAVKVIGWGEETIGNETIPYWIVANSWHDDWGENGYYRMIRGINDCGFEAEMVAGLF
ncbi:papain family cysteine protease [Teladorsagia circumcincta]|uniref:Papain family cysteine protease n=1 Tax=Teladorsagia circumcincta TaxID=45464 RepID=A0A2G9ULC2_TELCI|nr:papain family cysteine protease [Teladorsagia circumcincta]